MDKLLYIFRVYDLLYYASYRICMKSKNFSSSVAGYWLTETSEQLGILALCFFFLGILSIGLDYIFDNWKFYVIAVLIIYGFISRVLHQYHLSRHDAIIEKYSYIKSLRVCWLIYIAYGIITIALLISAGMFWNYRIHGHI